MNTIEVLSHNGIRIRRIGELGRVVLRKIGGGAMGCGVKFVSRGGGGGGGGGVLGGCGRGVGVWGNTTF